MGAPKLVALLFLQIVETLCEPGLFPETSNVAAEFSATSMCGNPPNLYCPPYRQTALIKCLTCNETSGDDVHPGEFAVDGDFSTFWQATTFKDKLNEMVNVSVSLGGTFQLDRSVITFNTYRPELMILEKSNDNGTTWTPLQYYAANCGGSIISITSAVERMRSDLPNENENTIAFCIQQDTTLQDPETGGTVTYDVTFRYGTNRFDVASTIAHTLVTNLRARFLNLDTRGDVFVSPNEQTFAGYYYAIEEWEVDARCYCYGHSNECVVDGSKMTRKCVCSHNTTEPYCDRCLPLFNNKRFRRGNSTHANPCEACECHDHADRCVYDEAKGFGVCVDCKHNTTGDHCDSCLPNFFRDPSKSLNDLQVCMECSNCDGAGTKSCNASGCICHPNVEGKFCQNCACGYEKIQEAVAVCQLCGCDTNGTIACSRRPKCEADQVVCNQISGECACKGNVMCLRCDTCKPGFHSAEFGCESCLCDLTGSIDNNCDHVTGKCACTVGYVGSKCNTCDQGFTRVANGSFTCVPCADLCNNHATQCDGETPVCDCLHNTTGDQCDVCAPGFFGDPTVGLPFDCGECESGPLCARRVFNQTTEGRQPLSKERVVAAAVSCVVIGIVIIAVVLIALWMKSKRGRRTLQQSLPMKSSPCYEPSGMLPAPMKTSPCYEPCGMRSSSHIPSPPLSQTGLGATASEL